MIKISNTNPILVNLIQGFHCK